MNDEVQVNNTTEAGQEHVVVQKTTNKTPSNTLKETTNQPSETSFVDRPASSIQLKSLLNMIA